MSRTNYLAALAFLASSAGPAVAGGDVLSAYQAYAYALNSGNAKMAASAYAPEARLVAGGPLCNFEAPCTTPDAVRATMVQWTEWGLNYTLTDAAPQVHGDMLVARIKITWTGIGDQGLARILGTNFVEAKDGKIVSKIFIPDTNDEQTKKWLATFSH